MWEANSCIYLDLCIILDDFSVLITVVSTHADKYESEI